MNTEPALSGGRIGARITSCSYAFGRWFSTQVYRRPSNEPQALAGGAGPKRIAPTSARPSQRSISAARGSANGCSCMRRASTRSIESTCDRRPGFTRSCPRRGLCLRSDPVLHSDKYDLGMEYTGWASPADRLVVRGSLTDREFVAFWLAEGHVVAAMNANVWDVAKPIERSSARAPPLPRMPSPTPRPRSTSWPAFRWRPDVPVEQATSRAHPNDSQLLPWQLRRSQSLMVVDSRWPISCQCS